MAKPNTQFSLEADIKRNTDKYPKRGEVGVLHLSPPCQTLSQANRHTDIDRVKTALLDDGALIPQVDAYQKTCL